MKRLLFIFILLSSCQERQDVVKNKLTAKGSLWVAVYGNSDLNKLDYKMSSYTIFYKDKSYKTALFSGEPNLVPLDDVKLYDSKWNYNYNDSCLLVGSSKFKVSRVLNDTILLIDERSNMLKLINIQFIKNNALNVQK